MSKNLDTYQSLNLIQPRFTYSLEYYPILTDRDYQKGEFIRYFVKKVNGSDWTEVDKNNFGAVSIELYEKFNLTWRISGQERNDPNDVIGDGVYEFNLQQIKSAEKSYSGISNKLINPLQFYKKS